MPGNEVGDRIHNFFGQENLSQGHHSQVADGSWPGLHNNLWVGSQRHNTPLVSNLKNYGVQSSADSERGHGGQSSGLQQGLNFSQSALKPEVARSHPHNLPTALNGYMHGHQALQTRQNESNFLGVDTEYNRHNLTSRGSPINASQLGNGSELNMRNAIHLESSESPVNYDFFGGQQQMSSQHPGMLQSLPRHQSGVNDMQLLQQQVMFKQIQEFQRQQQLHNAQFQQQEARQLTSINQIPSVVKQTAGSQTSAVINGMPIQDASNSSWQRELMGSNTNWIQHRPSPVMQGSSSGLLGSPDTGQIRLMGLSSQQADQSLYGVPITSTKVNASQYSPSHMDNSSMQQISSSFCSVPGNQFVGFQDQVGIQEGTAVSRQGNHGKGMNPPASGPAIDSGVHLEYLQQMNTQQRNAPNQAFHERQEFVGPSETSQEEPVLQAASSQNAATLDPEEEKILFGSDDSLWDAFGKSNNAGTGLSNMLDGPDLLGALPSLQSGSWSALMQSAVAETSSGDNGLQEGASGLDVPSGGPSTANQQLAYVNDGLKQPSTWPDNSLPTVSSVSTKSFPVSNAASTSINYGSVQGFQQSGTRNLHGKSEKLLSDVSQGFQQFSGDRGRWLDRTPPLKPMSEGSPFYGNVAHRPDNELNAKGMSASQIHQESMSSYNKSGQLCNRVNDWNSSGSVSPGGGSSLQDRSNESSFQQNQSSEYKNAMYDKMGHGSGMWKTDSVPNATEHAKSVIGFPQSNRGDSDFNHAAITSDSSTTKTNQKSSPHFPSSHNFNFWKNVDSSLNPRGNEFPGKQQQHLDKSPQNFESLGNNDPDKRGIDELGNSNIKEKVSEDLHSNISHHPMEDASDSRPLPGGKQKSSGHVSRKPSGTRKFQYHPMGDVDIDAEPSYGTKSVTHSQNAFQQASLGLTGHDQVSGHSKFLGPGAKSSTESEKVFLSGVRGDTRYLDEVPSKSMHPGSLPGTSAPSDRSVANHMPNKTAPTSKNMLELLHKVDQSREMSKEQGSATHFSSSDRDQSEMHEAETSDGSVSHLQQNQFSISQGFGLQLAPPSQRSSNPDHGSLQAANSPSLVHATSDFGKKGTWFTSASAQSLQSSRERSQIDSRSNISGTSGQVGHQASQYNIQGNYPAGISSGFPYQRSGAGGQVIPSQFVNASYSRFAPQSRQMDGSGERAQSTQTAIPPVLKTTDDINSSAEKSHPYNSKVQNHARGPAQQFPVLEAMPVSQPFQTPGMPQQGNLSKILPNAWAANHQNSSAVQTSPSLLNNSEKALSGPHKLDQIAAKGDSDPSAFAAYSVGQGVSGERQSAKEQIVSPENNTGRKSIGFPNLQGRESIANHLSSAPPSNSAPTQRDIEAFGRSLRPNNLLHHNYSLLHQMQAMKNIDADNRTAKRFKGAESDSDTTMIRDAHTNLASDLPGDSKVLGISSKSGDNRESTESPHVLASGNNVSQSLPDSNSAVADRGEHPRVSPQMAPSWFDQYGTLKNGQVFPINDSRRTIGMKNMEQLILSGKPSDFVHGGHSMPTNGTAGAIQPGNVNQSSSPVTVASKHHSSPQLLSPAVADESLAHVRPKKRKTTALEFLPWHREVIQGVQILQNISMAEVEWSQAANRLPERVEYGTELIEEPSMPSRARRRLVLTTQLVQQLLCPPPLNVMASEASSHFENVTYLVTRSALRDACSGLFSSRSDTSVHSEGENILPQNLSASKIGEQSIAKAVEDIIGRAKTLEENLLILDKRASILDLRVECQDLEKFSVINRFAKFHGRGQADAETSSSSDASANAQRPCPQRYVTALPMPRNVPDRVQCLSL